MVKHYLQAKQYYKHRKTKKLQAMTNNDSADDIPDGEDVHFDPRVALERNLETSSSEDEDNTEISRKPKKEEMNTKEHNNESKQKAAKKISQLKS